MTEENVAYFSQNEFIFSYEQLEISHPSLKDTNSNESDSDNEKNQQQTIENKILAPTRRKSSKTQLNQNNISSKSLADILTQYIEDDLLEKDEQYFFSKDQYFSPVKRGVVELDDKVFKIYTQALLHYKRQDVELDDIYTMDSSTHQNQIFTSKTSLLSYIDKQFTTINDQEIEQKAKALESLYQTLSFQFPGFFVPKLSKRQQKKLSNGLPQEKRESVKQYVIRLSDYLYLIQHPAFKAFIEKKIEIKKYLTDPNSFGFGLEGDPLDIADRFRETFGYLMEVQIKDSDIKIIDKFDQFIKNKYVELLQMKKDLKQLLDKCVSEYKMEGKMSTQKVTYQSFYYHLKTTAEVLGIKNKEFMNLQSTMQSLKLQKQREEVQLIMTYIDDELNELDSFKDAIVVLKRYLNTRNQLRLKMSKSVDQYNQYVVSKNLEGRRRSSQSEGNSDENHSSSNHSSSGSNTIVTRDSLKEQRDSKQKKNTVEKLEDEMEHLSFENAAYETICQIMIANMATFDIEKFKQQRHKSYCLLVQKLGRDKIEDFKNSNIHFEGLMTIMSNSNSSL
eukprot:403359287